MIKTYHILSNVFPAHAGMFRRTSRRSRHVPAFSPRTRGCSYSYTATEPRLGVFPAHAGMFHCGPPPRNLINSFPRARGDVPLSRSKHDASLMFSPRARGCSGSAHRFVAYLSVFPACAGMFRQWCPNGGNQCRFPRVRGDVPRSGLFSVMIVMFSPRARGCSSTAT